MRWLKFIGDASKIPATRIAFTNYSRTYLATRQGSGRLDADLRVVGLSDGGEIPIYDAEDPLDPIRLEIADPRVLKLDRDGGLHLKVQIGKTRWREAVRLNGYASLR